MRLIWPNTGSTMGFLAAYRARPVAVRSFFAIAAFGSPFAASAEAPSCGCDGALSVADRRSRYAEVFEESTNTRHKDWLVSPPAASD